MSEGIKTKDTSRRLGLVRVSEDALRKSINDGSAARIFQGSVTLEIQRAWFDRYNTYLLWHPQFDEVEEGALVPNYVAVIENGAVHWEKYEPASLEVLAEEVRKHGSERLASMAIAALANTRNGVR